MNKIFWIAGILIFISITTLVVFTDTSQTRRVRFSNQDLAITNNSDNTIDSTDTKISFSNTNITNTNIETTDSGLNIKNAGDIDSQSIDLHDNTEYYNQNTEYDDYDIEYENQKTGLRNEDPIEYKNLDTEHLDTILSDAKNISTKPVDMSNKPFKQMNRDRYQYKNIDWSTWRSNFVNKILDDSITIRSLDTYGAGTWFYYSFEVSATGEISNISITSMQLKDEDKKRVALLIKSYEYQDITIFPANSKRQKAKVSAVMVLSNETQHARPSDFSDLERIKLKL